jgi:Na+-driven multidrug efflux pump
MAGALTELIGLAAAVFPQAWIGIFSHDPAVLQIGAEYLHRVGPFFGFFGVGYALYCVGQATRRMEASVLAALLRAAIAVLGGLMVVWLKADVTWNFVAVALGMVAFGLFALPPLISRTAMNGGCWANWCVTRGRSENCRFHNSTRLAGDPQLRRSVRRQIHGGGSRF